MKRKRSLTALLLSVILTAGLVLPSAAAEAPGEDMPGTDISDQSLTILTEIGDEGGEEAEPLQESSEESRTSEESLSSSEGPDENVYAAGGSTSSWLSDYTYEIRGGELFLTSYKGERADVTVPGSADVGSTHYSRVFLSRNMWGETIESLTFEEGVALPADSSYMFSFPYEEYPCLASIDAGRLDTSRVTDMSHMFADCYNLEYLNVSGFDTSSVTNMECMFQNCSNLTDLDVSGFDTSSVTALAGMFSGCECLESLDVSRFDVTGISDLSSMFAECYSVEALNVSGFDTSAATSMNAMFRNCTSVTSLDVSGFDTSSVTDMGDMFFYCGSLQSLDVSGFDTSAVTNMNSMFGSCAGLPSLNVSGFDTSAVTDMSWMFGDCRSLQSLNVSGFDTSAVTNMSYMFDGCMKLPLIDVSGFDTSAVTDMSYMFYNCRGITGLDVTGFDTSAVENMSGMFMSCRNLAGLDVTGFDTSAVTNMNSMFNDCAAFTTLDVTGFDTSAVEDMSQMFSDCSGLTSLDVTGFNTSAVREMSYMFGECSSLTGIDVSRLDTSAVYDMTGMFCGCSGLTSLDVSSFDTSAVEMTNYMFGDCSSLASLDLSDFNTSAVYDMTGMFEDCSSLTSLNISSFVTGQVKDMQCMFRGCSALESLNVSSLDTSSVTSMGDMFSGCSSLISLDVSIFNTSSVEEMSWMFAGCSSLESLDLSGFDTSGVLYMTAMFEDCSSLESLDLSSFDLSSLEDADSMMDLHSQAAQVTILAPKGLLQDVPLDPDGGAFRDGSGNSYTSLPLNLTASITLTRSSAGASPSFISQPAYIPSDESGAARVEVSFQGSVSRGVWQHREAGAESWTDYLESTDQEILARLNLPDSPEWNGRAVRLVLYDGNEQSCISDELVLPAVVRDIENCTVRIPDGTYTGEAIIPEVSVSYGDYVLTEGKDFTLVFSDNVHAGSATAVLTGIGSFTGSRTLPFTIHKAVQNPEILAQADTLEAGETLHVTVTGAWGEVTFITSDAAVADVSSSGTVSGLSAGTAVVTAMAAGTQDYLPGSASLTLTVQETMFEITASAGQGGSISPSGTSSFHKGESPAFTITPDADYAIQDVLADGVSVGAVDSYTFKNVNGNHTISAVFRKLPAMLEMPVVASLTNVRAGIKIAWNGVEGAEKYRIYYKEGAGSWKRLAETTGTSYTWTGAESGKTYSFTLRCMNAAGTAFTSGYDNTGKSIVYIAAPSVTKLENLAGGVRITWTESAGAALYRIYYKEGSGGWKRLAETTDTSYTWTGAAGGKTYGFTVRCMNASGTSFTSGYDSAGMSMTYVKPVSIPEVTALSAVTGGLQITWSSYEGAEVYAVYYKTGTGAGGWKKLTNASGNTYTWTGAADGTTYSFTVRAMNAEGTSFISGYNNTGMSIAYEALVSIPRVTSVMNVQGGIKIAWSPFTGAGTYRIFYKESGGAWKKLTDARGTSYTWTGAEGGAAYAFTVRAMNAAGSAYVSGYDNTGKAITYVASPVITDLQQAAGGIRISWDACPGAGSYRVFVKTNGSGWKKLADTADPSYTWTGAVSGNTYGFTVRCMDEGSSSFVSGYDNTGVSMTFTE